MEPIKFLVATLALGAQALALPREARHQWIRDQARELRDKIITLRGPRGAYLVQLFEENPNDPHKRHMLEDFLSENISYTSEDIMNSALTLVSRVRNDDPSIAVLAQLDLDILHPDFQARQASGVSITGSGNIVVGNVKAGIEPVEPWPEAGTKRK